VGLVGLDSEGNKIYEFNSYRQAYETLGVSYSTLWRMIKSNKYKNKKHKDVLWVKRD